jgi:hypothetical protein
MPRTGSPAPPRSSSSANLRAVDGAAERSRPDQAQARAFAAFCARNPGYQAAARVDELRGSTADRVHRPFSCS